MSDFDLRPRVSRDDEWYNSGWFGTLLWCIWPGLPILFIFAFLLSWIVWVFSGSPIEVNPINDCASIECVEEYIEQEWVE